MLAINGLIPWRSKEREVTREDDSGSALSRFHSEVDRLFERFFDEPLWGGSRFSPDFGSWSGWSPSIDVTESESEITVRAEIPGVDPKDFDISVSGGTLTISGVKKEQSEESQGNRYRTERRFGSFRRSLALPQSVDTEKIEAEYDRGVLTVHLAKSEEAVTRRIPVSLKK